MRVTQGDGTFTIWDGESGTTLDLWNAGTYSNAKTTAAAFAGASKIRT